MAVDLRKVLLLGSGGLSIGQAGEFDYSGTQAIKALREAGLEVVVVNPNIATVQTNPEPNVSVYLYPVEPHWVEKVIEKERPQGIIAGFGGQTALNCLLALEDLGVLERYHVANLGTPSATIRITEDREHFANKMRDIDIPIPTSIAASTVFAAVDAANYIGYPVIVRAAYALGGLGSGFASCQEELENLVKPALASSPQVLIEKSLKGWKEVEYEVMRDGQGNSISICNMENFDPLGIHTGDSIVVAPSQTLSDQEYQLLRNAALKIVDALGVIGECNVQFALSPDSLDFYVIEVNARLSRSSALASKASGYPIAYIAAKVVLGYDLLELKNPVTGTTSAYFEPAFDYVTVKVPRWDLNKFPGVSRSLGSTMKSVGEVMAIGRNFPEAVQKAMRMVTESPDGLTREFQQATDDLLQENLKIPTDSRIYFVIESLRHGFSIEKIFELTSIDPWFLFQLTQIVDIEKDIYETAVAAISSGFFSTTESFIEGTFRPISRECWQRWKRYGFGDEQIAIIALRAFYRRPTSASKVSQKAGLQIGTKRKQAGVGPCIKRIDTTAGEHPSQSNYLYLTYDGSFSDSLKEDNRPTAVVLGCGAYRIGTSVEFDWCATSSSRQLQKAGWKSVIVNCNPETVSTDYNSSDHLYFEELSIETILNIAEIEKPAGVIVAMGGQIANKLALPLSAAGLSLLGHSPETIDMAEDRNKFSDLLDQLGIDQPRWTSATSLQEVNSFVEKVGLPVLVRPSYVLSGAAMKVAFDRASLDLFLSMAVDVSPDHPVVISEYIMGAREIELDGLAMGGKILTSVVSEHIENAGVHSGDATMVVPAQKLYVETVRQVRESSRAIARELKLNGPFNIQFLAQDNRIKVIECNSRASRSFPFVSKVTRLNFAEAATDIMIGKPPSLARLNEDELPYVGVKAAMFSFTRLSGADPVLGVEMASTGEVGCIASSFDAALLLAYEAAKIRVPKKGILVSAGPEQQKLKFIETLHVFKSLGIDIFATTGTAKYLEEHGFQVKSLAWPGYAKEDVLHAIREGWVDCVVNIPKNLKREELSFGAAIRQAASQYGCTLFTNMEAVTAFVQAIERCPDFVMKHKAMSLPGYRRRYAPRESVQG